jgi:PDZ domain-containing protein
LALVIVALLVAGCWIAITRGAHRYYVFSPGTAPILTANADCKDRSGNGALSLPDGTPCALLQVPASSNHGIGGKLYMVDVLVGPATPGEYLLSKLGLLHHFHDGMQLVPAKAVLGTTPAGQLGCQDTQQMNDSRVTAIIVALQRLGHPVTEKHLGARIDLVQPGSPAAAAGIQCNDVVTAVDGTPIHTAADLVSAVHAHHPGQSVTVTVTRTGSAGKTVADQVHTTLGTVPTPSASGRASGTGGSGGSSTTVPGPTAYLGVASVDATTYQYPFNVSVDVGSIGGPSAGLALTLGLLDVLSNGQLTGGHRVAATGTINPDGSVGDVGGVTQKTVAVRRAGADVFLVPTVEYKTATQEAGPHMKVFAVASLQQALDDLTSVGGKVATTPATTS